MSPELESDIRTLVAKVLSLPVEQVKLTSGLGTLPGWDSVGHMDLVLAVEEHFSVRFEPEEIERMADVGGIVEVVGKRRG